MTLYRVEWASDPAEGQNLDAWAVAADSEGAKAIALAAMRGIGLDWVRIVSVGSNQGAIWDDRDEAFSGIEELLGWSGRILPDSATGTALATPTETRQMDRMMAGFAAVARWGLERGLMDERDAALILAKISIAVER